MASPIFSPHPPAYTSQFLPPESPTPDQFAAWLADGRTALRDAADPLRLTSAVIDGRTTGPQRRRLLGRLIDGAKAELGSLARWLADNLAKGTATLAGWYRKFAGTSAAHNYAGVMAAMGTLDPTPADRKAADGEVRKQLGFLARFREQLRTGAQALYLPKVDPVTGERVVHGGFTRRSELYGESLWGVAEGVVREKMIREGFTHEKWNLDRAAHHCRDCPGLAARGWVAIGSSPAIGSVQCKTSCRCFMSYSHDDMIGDPASSSLGGRPA